MSSAPFLLLRIPSLKLRVRGRKEAFEANLKTETDLWNMMVKEMWAGRNMADQHKVRCGEDQTKRINERVTSSGELSRAWVTHTSHQCECQSL